MKITLKAARVNAGLTQQQAANKIGISQVAIVHWEKGIAAPRVQNFLRACTVYGVAPNNVFLPKEFGEVKQNTND